MNLKQHMVLIVGGVISLLLMIAALIFLFKFQGQYQQVKQDLENSQRQLEALQSRDPYPSKENVALLSENAEEREGFFNTLLDNLRKGQIEGQVMEAARFGTVLETTIRQLHRLSHEAGITLPDQFAFGFDRLYKGALASSEDIPRLYAQLMTTEKFSKLIIDSGIKEVVSAERERFDEEKEEEVVEVDTRRSSRRGRSTPAARRGRRGEAQASPAPAAKKEEMSDLYRKESLTLTLITREDGLWKLLDTLATSDLFAVVTSVELESEPPVPAKPPDAQDPNTRQVGTGGMPEGLGMGAAETPVEIEPPSRDERVVAGRERVKVTLGVDVVHFPEEETEEDAAVTE